MTFLDIPAWIPGDDSPDDVRPDDPSIWPSDSFKNLSEMGEGKPPRDKRE